MKSDMSTRNSIKDTFENLNKQINFGDDMTIIF